MEFEWNPEKAKANLKNHKASFEEAKTVFNDPLYVVFNDPDHSLEEMRLILMGQSAKNRLLVVSFTKRPPATRLISARKATRAERKNYEEEL